MPVKTRADVPILDVKEKRVTNNDKTANEQIRSWVQDRINGQAAVALPALADAGLAHFVGETDLIRALFGEKLRAIIYDTAQRVFAETRPGAVKLGDEIVDQDEMKQRASRIQVKWAQWLEHASDTHVRLTAMDRVQLLTAAAERDARAESEFKHARFLRELAEPLKKGQTVGQVFKPEEIEAMWLRVHGQAQPRNAEKAA